MGRKDVLFRLLGWSIEGGSPQFLRPVGQFFKIVVPIIPILVGGYRANPLVIWHSYGKSQSLRDNSSINGQCSFANFDKLLEHTPNFCWLLSQKCCLLEDTSTSRGSWAYKLGYPWSMVVTHLSWDIRPVSMVIFGYALTRWDCTPKYYPPSSGHHSMVIPSQAVQILRL